MKIWSVALRLLLLVTVLTGLIYPLAVTLIGRLVFPFQVSGSLLEDAFKNPIGSEWIAQEFKSPHYFWSRPSAVDFNPMPSGGSNLGPTSAALAVKVRERAAQGLSHEMLFASASGLDPHISPESAESQMARVAQARGLSPEALHAAVLALTEGRQWGLLGEPRVNVLKLNLALDKR